MFKEERKSPQFDWSHLGDIEWGRPNRLLKNSSNIETF